MTRQHFCSGARDDSSTVDLIEKATDFRKRNPEFAQGYQEFQQSFQKYLAVKDRMFPGNEMQSTDLRFKIVE